MKTSPILFLFLYLPFFSCQIFAQAEKVKSITVVSCWNGLGTPSESRLKIVRKGENFFANGKKIQTELISELLSQIESDAEKRELSDFGITQEWLDQNAEKALPELLRDAAENEKLLFLNHFRDIVFVEKILPTVLGGGWTDDYPSFEMEILKTDGSEIKIASARQGIFMLPFDLTEKDGEFLFSSPKLSKSIAAVLPKKFANRGRLNGDRLADKIAEIIFREINDELEELETRNKIGNELAQIQDKYSIKKTALNHLSSIDAGTPKSAYQTKEYKKWNFPSWNAELHRNDLPPNVIIGVSLPYREKKLDTFPVFLEKIDGIVDQTLSVPWLSKYIADKPDIEFEIRFVETSSLSLKAKESFLEDLNKFGASRLNSEILSKLDKSVFLQVSEKYPSNWSRWLILPDKRMILWQIRGDSVLKWKPSDFETLNLYDSKDWFQTKAVISPNGEIESR